MKNVNYVLHVKKGYEDREQSVVEQFARMGENFEWVLDYDKDEITPELLDRYGYSGDLQKNVISCSLKHIRAWEMIADSDADGAFVFEDDVLIDTQRFKAVSLAALAEFQRLGSGAGYISLGDGCALYVPWTKRRKNQRLYLAQCVRATDSYWVSTETAQKMLQFIKTNGFSMPADHMIDRVCAEQGVAIFWMEPTVVSQGSHTGRFTSSIQKLERGGFVDKIGWKIKIFRRKYLYPLFGIDLRKTG